MKRFLLVLVLLLTSCTSAPSEQSESIDAFAPCSSIKTTGMKADGIFGTGTAKQVKRFQKSVGLKQTGVIDRTTWLSLLAASATLAP